MTKRNIYNSSSKIIGNIEIYDDRIVINNKDKPQLVITEKEVLAVQGTRELNESVIFHLYDDYTMCIGEIASIFDVLYYKINKVILNGSPKTSKHNGRRNRSFGVKFKKETIQKMTKAHIGKHTYNNGVHEKMLFDNEDIPNGYVKGRLPFSEEHRRKIAKTVKKNQEDGKTPSPVEISRMGWRNGKFDNVDFKRGIGGFVSSKKMGKRFFFRSLLELYYIIFFLEENDDVVCYEYEPFRVRCDNGSSYTPDFFVNGKDVVELKSYYFIYKQGGKIQEKFEYKCLQAENYCRKNNLLFKVVFDKDIGFEYKKLIHTLKEEDYVSKYEIEFLQPERVWSRK